MSSIIHHLSEKNIESNKLPLFESNMHGYPTNNNIHHERGKAYSK